ncbi:polyketide cyclase [Actinoplanes sp. NPDC023714]|uniref:polyketide cyclase n=1 Tax=Actinoplanes sp. NPDC023714 TaxID=3154322 RepID=UPI0033EB3EA0
MLGDRWGVHDDETRLVFPCDAFVAEPTLRAWRGVDVAAPAAELWPWVAQVRKGPYSYDVIDNWGRRSPRHLLGLPEPRVGEPFTSSGGRPLGRIVSVEPAHQLTGAIMGGFMSYVLVPVTTARTRLLLKVVARTPPLIAVALSVGDLVMARRQLLTFKALAERNCQTRAS